MCTGRTAFFGPECFAFPNQMVLDLFLNMGKFAPFESKRTISGL